MSTILVAFDFSGCARTAARLAVGLARRRGATLLLLHVVEPPPVELATLPVGTTGWEEDLLGTAKAELDREAGDLRRRGVTVETRVLFGSSSRSILEAAREARADLVVMGTHGRKGAAHLFLGSVAERVIRGAGCPVLVTHEAVPDVVRWDGGEALRLTVVADGTRASQAAFYWARTSATSFAGDVSLVRLYWPPLEAARYGLDEPWQGEEGHPDLIRVLERDLRRDARALAGAHDPPIRFRVAGHDAPGRLTDDVRALGGDALVLAVSGSARGDWSPLPVASILRSAGVPVFCVPAAIQPAERHLTPVRSVLVACDLSESSKAALLPAYGLLAGGGRVELCYVHVLGPPDGIAEVPGIAPLTEPERAEIEAQLRAMVPAEAPEHGIATHVSVVEGRFADEAILAAAERLDTDVVAIGSHGRTGIARALLGSVAEQVSRRSRRPVIIVRSHPKGL